LILIGKGVLRMRGGGGRHLEEKKVSKTYRGAVLSKRVTTPR